MRRLLIFILAGIAFGQAAFAQAPDVSAEARTSVGLAVYNDGYGVVRDDRTANLPLGRNTVRLTDIAPQLQPETFHLTVPAGASLVSLKRTLETLSPGALLNAYVGKEIRWLSTNPATGEKRVESVTLVGINGGTIIERHDRIEINPPGRPAFPEIPAHLSGKQGLDATIATTAAGPARLGLTYITGGLVWSVDYVASLDDKNSMLTLDGFASVTNTSGLDYNAAVISLIAGSVRRVSNTPRVRAMAKSLNATAMMDSEAAGAPVPEVSEVGDYHRYDLPEATDLTDGVTNQMRLFNTATLPVRKVYRLGGYPQFIDRPVQGGKAMINPSVDLVFKNEPDVGLGLPLPAGIVRVYSAPRDSKDATAVFLGENRIGHTPTGEEISLSIGQSFDIVAERVQTDFRRIGNQGEFESAHEITIRNNKTTGVTVEVSEQLYGQWKIVSESQNHVRRDSQTAVWNVSVPASGETVLTYRINVRP